ncbi:uncharacterized protein LOC136717093 [Amia ocellicauda]|uniref:uncharacterized protein LOC136717093 n=1 Tax=Amia ocellicauda TaxID=2972642 RepID=UPI0034641C07
MMMSCRATKFRYVKRTGGGRAGCSSAVVAVSVVQLPQEIWLHVFRLLTAQEKGVVRATCWYFKQLIDQSTLWKNSKVVLKKIDAYNPAFWATLRKRGTSAVVVRKMGTKQWKQLATKMPWVTALAIEEWSDGNVLATLPQFMNLKKLVIRSSHCPPGLHDLLASLQQLTHLTLCQFDCPQRAQLIDTVSRLTHLNSLVFHEGLEHIPTHAFHSLLSSLPNLKELSLNVKTFSYKPLPADYFVLPKSINEIEEPYVPQLGLTKLELLNYKDSFLSQSSIEQLSALRSLAIHFEDHTAAPSLTTLLSNLPCLKELTVQRGGPFNVYVGSIPATLDSLSLSGVFVSLEDMRTLSKQAAGLRHLHMDLSVNSTHLSVLDFPQLFPHLRTLQLRHCNVTKEELLGLARLHYLEKLAVLGSCPLGMIQDFKILTDNRVQLLQSLLPLDHMTCLCMQG